MRVEGGGSGAPPSAMSVGGGSGAPPSAMSVGGGSGAPPSATSEGGGSGAPPSARIVALSGLFAKPANPQVVPSNVTKPRHTNRIFPKCIVSSSEVHGARKNLTPSTKYAWSLRLPLFSLGREGNLLGFPTKQSHFSGPQDVTGDDYCREDARV